MLGETNNQFSMALHLNDIKFFTCFYVHKDLRLIRFLPAPTARNVLDFNQNSLHLDACMPLAHFAELLAGRVGDWHVLFCRFQ
jgi:hypothetical protein